MKSGILTKALSLWRRPAVKRGIQLALLAIIVFFVGRSLSTGWRQIQSYSWHIQWGALLLGFLFFIGQELTYGVIWRSIVQRLGYRLPWIVALRIYLSAEFVRYIPGNVWHVITRVIWAEHEGVPKTQGFASMTVELATKITGAFMLFVVSLLLWPSHAFSQTYSNTLLTWSVALVGMPLIAIGLHPRILQGSLNIGMKLLKRAPTTLNLRYRDILLTTMQWMGSWLMGGLGFWLTLAATTSMPLSLATFIVASGVYALGWDIGFLSFITPSGLFFREGAVALLLVLTHLAPTIAIASLLAILAARLLPTLAELLSVGWAYFQTRSNPRMSITESTV